MPQTYIGCDLSRDRIDVFDPRIGHATSHPNSPAGLKALFEACRPEAILVVEATSGCDQALLRACTTASRPFVRLNPLHAWHFAQSLNLPKTDRTDARMLARLGAERRPAPHRPPDPARGELAELADRRDQLKRMETQEKNRLGKTAAPLIRPVDPRRYPRLAQGPFRPDQALRGRDRRLSGPQPRPRPRR